MNKTIIFTLMVVGLFFASCGGSNEPKTITPTSTEFIQENWQSMWKS